MVLRKRAREVAVRPRSDQQPLPLASRVGPAFGAHPDVVLDGAVEEQVVPAADVERWHLYLSVPAVDREPPPVLVARRMRDPVEVVRRARALAENRQPR